MLQIFRKLQKKLQRNFLFFAVFLITFTVHAEPCEECNKIHSDLSKEAVLRETYVALKIKNEEYLKKPSVPAGAAIKVQSNLMLLGIKIETQDNKIEALKLQKKKFNDCATCPISKPEKS